MERVLILVIVIWTLGCSNKNAGNKDNEFVDLNESEKSGVFSQLGEEFKGDYRKYSGQNEDSTKVLLVLNKDNRFAIGFKSSFKTENSDSLATFEFSTTPEFKNLCIGKWTEEGKSIRLNFLLGQSTFFDSLKNDGVATIVDDKTVLLDKSANEVWISKALCKRE
jgi:hypothetical protein